jgi:Spy/CpxP family protein refolding chaperone
MTSTKIIAGCLVVAALALAAGSPAARAEGRESSDPAPAWGRAMADRGAIPGIDPNALAALKMTADQRKAVTEIERDLKRKQWTFIGSLRELQWKQHDAFSVPEVDAQAVRRNFDEISALRRQIFEATLDSRKRIESVLTKEQRARLSDAAGSSQSANAATPPAGSPRNR